MGYRILYVVVICHAVGEPWSRSHLQEGIELERTMAHTVAPVPTATIFDESFYTLCSRRQLSNGMLELDLLDSLCRFIMALIAKSNRKPGLLQLTAALCLRWGFL
jgi:hypothetical protein